MKMKMKKSVYKWYLMLITVSLFILFLVPSVYAESKYAKADAANGNTNVNKVAFSNGSLSKKKLDDVMAYNLQGSVSFARDLYIDISDSFLYGDAGFETEVVIEYYDEGKGAFSLNYSSLNVENSNMYDKRKEIALTGTNRWKTYTEKLSDIAFINSAGNNSDICIKMEKDADGNYGDSLLIKSVKVNVIKAGVPIYFTVDSEAYGNIFDTCNQNFKVKLQNTSDSPQEVTLRYYVLDGGGEVYGDVKYANVTVPKKDVGIVAVSENVQRYGTYRLAVEMTINNAGGYNKYIPFSHINASDKLSNRLYTCVHMDRYNNEEEVVKAIGKAGFGGMRQDIIPWHIVELKKSEYSLPKKQAASMELFKKYGQDAFMVLAFGNKFYDQPADGSTNIKIVPHSDEGIAAYAEYCKYIAQQYKGQVKCYEIWNEYFAVPNLAAFNPEARDGANYAKLLKAAYTAIKSVDKDAIVVAGAMAGTPISCIRDMLSQKNEKTGFDVNDYFDVISFHPYQGHGNYNDEKFVSQMNEVKSVLAEYGCNKPIWFTEMGWTNSTQNIITEYSQATNGIKFFFTGLANDFFERMYWYDFVSDNSRDEADYEGNFGLIKSDVIGVSEVVSGAAKKAYVAFAGLNKVFDNGKYIKSLDCPGVKAYEFRRSDGSYMAVLWSDTNRTVNLDIGAKYAQQLDMYSNVTRELSSLSGKYCINVGTEPVYLLGDFEKFDTYNATSQVEINVSNIKDDSKIFYVNATNNSDSDMDVILGAEFYDEHNRIAQNSQIEFRAKKHTNYVKPIDIPALDKGEYKVIVTLQTSDYTMAKETGYTVTKNKVNNYVDIGYTGGSYFVRGVTSKVLLPVSVCAYTVDNKFMYVDQKKSGEDGSYSFEFSSDGNEICKILFYDGSNDSPSASDVEIKVMNDNKNVLKMSDIDKSKPVYALINIPKDVQLDDTKIYCAIYGANELSELKITSVDLQGNKNFIIPVSIDETTQKISFFVWNGNLQPLVDSCKID